MENIIQLITEAKQKRAKVVEDQRGILAKAREEKRSFNADEDAAYNKAETDFKTFDDEVRRLETLKEREERLAMDQHEQRGGGNSAPGDDEDGSNDEGESRANLLAETRYSRAFYKMCRSGFGGLTPDEKKWLRSGRAVDGEQRAQTTQTDSSGGYLVPTGFVKKVYGKMAYYGPMLDGNVVGGFTTSSGNPIEYPTDDDTSTVGELLTENSEGNAADLAFGVVVFNAYKYGSKPILVPYELLEDEDVGLENLITDRIAKRLGRIGNTHLTTGDNSGKPNGIVTSAGTGVTGSAAAAIAYNDMLALEHSVNISYRMGPKVCYMLNDNTVLKLKQLSLGSGDATPLWQPSTQAGTPDRINGYKYVINPYMANVGASAVSVLFGDMDAYQVRRVGGIRFKRLDERYAEKDQVAFLAFMRMDGEMMDATAIKKLTHPAS